MRRLLEPFTVERPPPENLDPADEPLFAHERRRSFGATDLYDLRNVRVTADGVVVRGLRAVDELTLSKETIGAGRRYALAALRRPRRRFADRERRYVAAFNQWSPNYFHWLCDVLPRLYLIRDDLRGGTLVLPSTHRASFVEESLEPFGLTGLERFEPDETAWFRRVAVPGHVATSGNYHPETMRGLAAFLRAGLGVEPGDGALVYATRSGAGYRHLENEAEVTELLRGLGFAIVANEELSFREQVRLYSGARLVVGPMGANLANVLFLPPGATLLQLSRAGDAENNLYWALAAAVGARFRYQQCAYTDTRAGNFWNLRVDLEALRDNVEAALSAR